MCVVVLVGAALLCVVAWGRVSVRPPVHPCGLLCVVVCALLCGCGACACVIVCALLRGFWCVCVCDCDCVW